MGGALIALIIRVRICPSVLEPCMYWRTMLRVSMSGGFHVFNHKRSAGVEFSKYARADHLMWSPLDPVQVASREGSEARASTAGES